MDNIMDERFTAQEIDAIKAEADLDIKRPLLSLEDRVEKIRDLKMFNGDGNFWRRKYCVLFEALRLAKMELQAANNELDVLRESLTCQTRYGNTLQDTIDLQISKLQIQDGTIERLENDIAKRESENKELRKMADSVVKWSGELVNMGKDSLNHMKALRAGFRSALSRRNVCIGLLVASNILLGIYTVVKYFV